MSLATDGKVLQFSDVAIACAERGIVLTNRSAGPFVSLNATWSSTAEQAGWISGAILPGKRLHIESYKAAPATRYSAATANRPAEDAEAPDAIVQRKYGSLLRLSPGMLLFIAAIAIGAEKGCNAVYGLAIDDEKEQHRRLVRYLRRFGGEKVRRVGDSLRDVPDRLFYGGCGTIIRGDIGKMLSRATLMIERTASSPTNSDSDTDTQSATSTDVA